MALIFDTSFIDPTLPDVTLKIGGKDRRLAFDYHAMVVAEKLTGENMLSGLWNASFGTLGGLLFAALKKDDPELTLDEVGPWINFKNAQIVYQAIMAAWTGSVPEAVVEPGEAKAQAVQPNAA